MSDDSWSVICFVSDSGRLRLTRIVVFTRPTSSSLSNWGLGYHEFYAAIRDVSIRLSPEEHPERTMNHEFETIDTLIEDFLNSQPCASVKFVRYVQAAKLRLCVREQSLSLPETVSCRLPPRLLRSRQEKAETWLRS